MTSILLFRRLLAYSFAYWPAFLLSVLAMLISAAAETAFPALMKTLMDDGFSSAKSFHLAWVPVTILVIFSVRGVAGFVATYVMYWLAQNVLRDIRAALFWKLMILPSASYDSRTAGGLISKLVNDAQQVLTAATNVVTSLIRDSILLIGLLGWLLWINWRLTLIVALLIPPLAYLTRKFSDRMRSVGAAYLNNISEMTAVVEEAVAANRVVKSFDAQDYEKLKFRKVNTEHRAQGMRLSIASALQGPVTQIIASFGIATILTIALYQTRAGQATIGDFVSFITAMIMMLNPLRHLSDINSQLQRGLAAAEGLFTLLDEPEEVDQGTKTLDSCSGKIHFKNVTFCYRLRSTPAIRNFSLEIHSGKTIALVGPSGSGKTTLLNLLPRLYEVDSGVIEIDGVDTKELTLRALRKSISYVSQDAILFNDTIAANISYGRPQCDRTDLRNAAAAAELLEFIDSLPLGFETVIGDRGVRLSGGQRQRISIARAIVKNSSILLLDEATAALDSRTEAYVQEAIDWLRKGRTTIIVAHRLSTVVSADEIVVMDHGLIVQRGRHADLILQSGLYQRLYSGLSND
jgi:ATP-binding cassette, subfamily B, bacterial MsbA